MEQFAIALAAFAAATSTDAFSGVAKAIDGDSLVVGSYEVRLFGIDAPEFRQTCTQSGKAWACGEEAANRLSRLVNGKEVRCSSLGMDQHGRTLARCSVGGTDINRTMVATGYADAFRRYSMDYFSADDSAKAGRRGIWIGEFQMPSDVRHADDQPLPKSNVPSARNERVERPKTRPSVSGSCTIKGNRGRHGWIYHVPGMPYYAETVAEEMFCTEGQAQAAGYRRSRADRHR
jgi:endonuclease YncB( thermonuclease family)